MVHLCKLVKMFIKKANQNINTLGIYLYYSNQAWQVDFSANFNIVKRQVVAPYRLMFIRPNTFICRKLWQCHESCCRHTQRLITFIHYKLVQQDFSVTECNLGISLIYKTYIWLLFQRKSWRSYNFANWRELPQKHPNICWSCPLEYVHIK